jgi:hypothetical protein
MPTLRNRWDRLLDRLASLWTPPLFVIRVRNGATTTSGRVVTSGFLGVCGELLRDHGIAECTIRGVRSAHGASLRFSRAVPDAVRQKLRNAWSAYR